MIRFPLGGNLSWSLQWLAGLQRLGHEVWLVEKADYADECFDPAAQVVSDDATYGMKAVDELLTEFGLQQRWCFVDRSREYYGLSRSQIEEVFRTADLFLDLGTHGSWLEEASGCGVRVVVDGEPGATQARMERKKWGRSGGDGYDFYYTNGANLPIGASDAPVAGRAWRAVYNPVVSELFPVSTPPAGAAYTTVMNWKAHQTFEYGGRAYGQKDVEFQKFVCLPEVSGMPLEIAVDPAAPGKDLGDHGWSVRPAQQTALTFADYRHYIARSRGEFSVCKNVYVAMRTGWFSDRSAAYLASGRPVVMQETGFSAHLPCGRGLFACNDVREAAEALHAVERDWECHSRWAREIAAEHLDARKVLPRLLSEIGIS
jgi:hypothetical protein